MNFCINMYISRVSNVIPLKVHARIENFSTPSTMCEFFFFPLDMNTDAAGAPYLRKVLQSLKIPKAPLAQSISLFPALQTNAQLPSPGATYEIPWSNTRITHFHYHPGWQKPPEMLPPPGLAPSANLISLIWSPS